MESRAKRIERIELLFNLGRSPNSNEAAAAVAKAKQLMDEYNIEQYEIKKVKSDSVIRYDTNYYIKRLKRHHYRIFDLLRSFFYVDCICVYTNKGLQLILIGLPIYVEVADVLYGKVLKIFTNQVSQYKKVLKAKKDVFYYESYVDGFFNGIVLQLRSQRQRDEKLQQNQNALIISEQVIKAAIDDFEKEHLNMKETYERRVIDLDVVTWQDAFRAGKRAEIRSKIR
ncbi:MAG: DUF2786 domain-containing protein [Bacteroidales bacterium]|jgi:hypothetical protein|nr:DUF2786 domain-containing protein [Bacteroidales bacterium]